LYNNFSSKDELVAAYLDLAELLPYLPEGAVTTAGLDNSPERLHRARDMPARVLGPAG
jgi:hypothetical protein